MDEAELVDTRDVYAVQTSWLRSFLAVVEAGGFRSSASALHLSQSRISAHIADLEHALGVTLVDRSRRPVQPTAAGVAFRDHARAAITELQRGIQASRTVGERRARQIRIGSFASASVCYLPGMLRSLQHNSPGISIELHEGTAHDLERAVTDGSVDVALRPLLPVPTHPDVEHRLLWTEDIVAVVRADDSLACRPWVTPADLIDRDLIGSPAGSWSGGGGSDLRHSLGELGDRAHVAFLTDQPTTLAALVRSGLGVGVTNRLALQAADFSGLVTPAIQAPWRRSS